MFDVEVIDGVMWIRMTGAITRALLIDAVGAAQRHPDVSDHRIWDVRNGTIDLSNADIQYIATQLRNSDAKNARVAIVASSDLLFGVSRMYSAFRESSKVQMAVFRSAEEAKEWLATRSL